MSATKTDLIEGLAADVGVAPLTAAEIEACLGLAAVAAHGTGDRTTAPLATFLAGIAAAGADDRAARIEDLRRRAAELAPETEAAQ